MLGDNLSELLTFAGIRREPMTDRQIQFNRRKTQDFTLYLITNQSGADHGPLVVEKRHPFVVARGVGNQDLVISGKQLLQLGQPVQVGLHFLDRNDVESLADVSDILQRTHLLFVGKLRDVP